MNKKELKKELEKELENALLFQQENIDGGYFDIAQEVQEDINYLKAQLQIITPEYSEII